MFLKTNQLFWAYHYCFEVFKKIPKELQVSFNQVKFKSSNSPAGTVHLVWDFCL